MTIGAFTLGNSRLAIQDPSPAGNQPFVSGDGRYHCVFNGEIYNYRQLIQRYQLPMHTGCDGEVIPALWAKLGLDALAELRGMYAIALVDSLEERVYLARDPFGIKPLYWRTMPDGSHGLRVGGARPWLAWLLASSWIASPSHGTCTWGQWQPTSPHSPR